MTTQTNTLSNNLKNDFQRNRDGKLSSRQWMELITEPMISLMLLSVPLILLVGRFGIAGRYIVLLVVVGFVIMTLLRAIRFSRVKLTYRVLFAEQSYPRWMFWRKTTLTTKSGESVRFHYHVVRKLDLPQNEALSVYYIVVADRLILLSAISQKHPQAHIAEPTPVFTRRGGTILDS